MRRKSSAQLSNEELLKLVEQSPARDKRGVSNDPILAFIYAHNIDNGYKEVPAKALYKLYQKSDKTPVDFKTFTRRLNEFFVSFIYGAKRYYRLNKTALTLLEPLYNEVANSKKRSKPFQQRNFLSFISDTKLSQGPHYIEGYIIYHMYLDWKDSHPKGDLLGQMTFYKVMDLYFKHKVRQYHGKFYAIDLTQQTYLTPKRLAALRRHRREKATYEGKKKKSSNKKEENQKVETDQQQGQASLSSIES